MYDRWLKYVFDRPETPSGWYFDLDLEAFDATPCEVVSLIDMTCARCGTDLLKYDLRQVNEGIDFIFNNSCSDLVFSLKDTGVQIDSRLRAIRSIRTLYSDCFAVRCSEGLSHLDQPTTNPLNKICYMFWDVTPLRFWESSPEKSITYPAILELLESVLELPHMACVEGALHGLWHVQPYAPKEVDAIVSRCLARTGAHWPEPLRHYAALARIGRVQ